MALKNQCVVLHSLKDFSSIFVAFTYFSLVSVAAWLVVGLLVAGSSLGNADSAGPVDEQEDFFTEVQGLILKVFFSD